jgi:hypothetical protein
VISAVEGLIAELRQIGFSISVSENIDAVDALRYVEIGDREAVKTALGSVLVKDYEHQSAYEAVFDVFFSLRSAPEEETSSESGSAPEGMDGEGESQGHQPGTGGGGLDGLDDAGIHELLIKALKSNEQVLLKTLARMYVSRHAGIQPGRAVAGTYYLFRTMRAVGPERVLTRLVEDATDEGDGQSALDRRLLVEDNERRVTTFQQEIESEIRRRLVADRGADAVAKRCAVRCRRTLIS